MDTSMPVANTARDRHLFGPGPKRILALDGGGVRGALSIGMLERLEDLVAEREGKATRLCDWFDLIGGTSTGAIIATGLALGYSARDIRAFYADLAPRVFRRPLLRLPGLQAKFDARLLQQELTAVFGTRRLDTEDLQTGLCLTLKRMDTGSAWILMNNPRSRFWLTPDDGAFTGNHALPLVNLVRASAAAPHFFDPEIISIVEGQPEGLFIDGGLTPHNNPSVILLLAASLPPYGLNWPLGPDKLTIVSIGTGSFRPKLAASELSWARPIGLALKALTAQIAEAQQLTLTLMSWMGTSPTPWEINSEIGDLGPVDPPFGPQFRFLRYDVRLEKPWLERHLGSSPDERELASLRLMDKPGNVPACYELGRRAAELQMRIEHLG